MPYSDDEYAKDKERILSALDAVFELQERYKDVIAIPDVIALHDVMDYRLQTAHGIRKFSDAFSKKDAEFVLQQFVRREFVTPEKFEDTIVSALNTIHKD